MRPYSVYAVDENRAFGLSFLHLDCLTLTFTLPDGPEIKARDNGSTGWINQHYTHTPRTPLLWAGNDKNRGPTLPRNYPTDAGHHVSYANNKEMDANTTRLALAIIESLSACGAQPSPGKLPRTVYL
jgi:hypothetical protein